MLNKRNTKVLTLAILLPLGITAEFTARSERAIFFSSRDKLNMLEEYIWVGNRNSNIDSKITDSYQNNLPNAIIVQASSPSNFSNNNQTDKNPYALFWWLAPLIILVSFLGFFLLKTGSKSKTQPIDEELSQHENSESSQNLVDEVEAGPALKKRATLDSDNLKTSSASESPIDAELSQSIPDSLTDSEKVESNPVPQSTVAAELSQSTSDPVVESEEIVSEEAEAITNQELDNISEWLNEKIDSASTDISSLDDFWDSLDSVDEEISEEITLEEAETITNQELASISEWLNESIDLADEELSSDANLSVSVAPDSNLIDTTQDNIDELFNLIEGIDIDSSEEILEHNFNLLDNKTENIPNLGENFTSQASELKSDYLEEFDIDEENNTKTTEGINDVTSNFLEELLNEDLNQEDKHKN